MSLSALHLTLSQVQPSHIPTILITLKNTSPSTPYTILTWNSPLDPLLIQLGLLSITLPGSSDPVDIPQIMIKRRMPPSEEHIVTLEPGEETNRKVEIGERFVAPEQWGHGKGKVAVRGRWNAVWPGLRKEDVLGNEKRLAAVGGDGGGELLTGEFESEVLEIDV